MDYLDLSLEQKQTLAAQALRAKMLLGENSQQQNKFSTLAAASHLFNNPALAQAAQAAHQAQRQRYAPLAASAQGVMLPDGEVAQSPLYSGERMEMRNQQRTMAEAQVAARAEQQAAQLAAQREMQAERLEAQRQRAAEANALRMTIASMRNSGGSGGGSAATEKPADPGFKETDIQKLAQFADKKQLPRLGSQARQLFTQLEAMGDKTPGFSASEQLLQRTPFGDRVLSKEALDNMAAINGIYNAFTRADAGLSQTLGETQRQALEMFNSPSTSAKTRAQIFRTHIIPLIDQAKGSALGSANPAALAEYRKRQEALGAATDWMDVLAPAKPAQAAPQAVPPGLQLPPGFKLIGPAP
jgi:hypothetical protein